jgi:hypothetical protein
MRRVASEISIGGGTSEKVSSLSVLSFFSFINRPIILKTAMITKIKKPRRSSIG